MSQVIRSQSETLVMEARAAGQVSPLSQTVEQGGVEYQLNIVWQERDWGYWLPGSKGPGWVWQAEPPPGRAGLSSCLPYATEEEALEAGLEGVARLGPRLKDPPESSSSEQAG